MVGVPTSFVIGSSWLSKGKGKGEVIDSEVFWVFLNVDLTVICCLTGSFLSYFGVVVLRGRFCEGKEPGSNFHLKNYFLISFFIKWRWHKIVFEETLNPSLLFCLFIRLHQRLIFEGNEGNFKKCMPVAVPSLS